MVNCRCAMYLYFPINKQIVNHLAKNKGYKIECFAKIKGFIF